jgi:hypothetical protein
MARIQSLLLEKALVNWYIIEAGLKTIAIEEFKLLI